MGQLVSAVRGDRCWFCSDSCINISVPETCPTTNWSPWSFFCMSCFSALSLLSLLVRIEGREGLTIGTTTDPTAEDNWDRVDREVSATTTTIGTTIEIQITETIVEDQSRVEVVEVVTSQITNIREKISLSAGGLVVQSSPREMLRGSALTMVWSQSVLTAEPRRIISLVSLHRTDKDTSGQVARSTMETSDGHQAEDTMMSTGLILAELADLSLTTERGMNFVWLFSTISMLMASGSMMCHVTTRNQPSVRLNWFDTQSTFIYIWLLFILVFTFYIADIFILKQ